jgi:threonine dehydrogenase-like Zn-dependent dehydrogenase
VTGLAKGDFVVPFTYSDGTCPHCLAGWTSNCANGGSFGNHGVDGGR